MLVGGLPEHEVEGVEVRSSLSTKWGRAAEVGIVSEAVVHGRSNGRGGAAGGVAEGGDVCIGGKSRGGGKWSGWGVPVVCHRRRRELLVRMEAAQGRTAAGGLTPTAAGVRESTGS